jgi:hypothetical protein
MVTAIMMIPALVIVVTPVMPVVVSVIVPQARNNIWLPGFDILFQ